MNRGQGRKSQRRKDFFVNIVGKQEKEIYLFKRLTRPIRIKDSIDCYCHIKH